ncbi:MAG: tetraacyldisaccharide 4'-kinase [Sandaracinaceae bacterium]|nr:tetraacyldisaccharide 4'-kinase [Sandaracinaceae bacterium]
MGDKCIVMGAAGRDFHDFLTFLRARPQLEVVCFTAEQIPFIDARTFPASLAGPHYPNGIPIEPEHELPRLIREHAVDHVFLSYSDLAHEDVMHKASIVQAAGASFALLGPKHTQLTSRLPVVSVTAARTGAGKSPLSQAIARRLADRGVRAAVLRHPMPYGDLAKQAVQRFATPEDLDRHECTIEEREEYEPYLELGLVVWAGVDYASILAAAEQEAELILWDGGNNDTSFVKADLSIVVLDALRPGHETRYYPGETNLRLADVLVLSKAGQASAEALAALRATCAATNPRARVVEAELEVHATPSGAIRGRRALVVEDGPTITHGGMPSGAGLLAATREGAAELVDPRPHAVGSIAAAYRDHPHIGPVLPALGYSAAQRAELEATIRHAAPDVVVDASPARLGRLISIDAPIVEVGYRFVQRSGADLFEEVDRVLGTSRA